MRAFPNMSRTSEQKVQNTPVVVRAYGDEPVKLLVRAHHGQAVELVFEDRDVVVVFPAADVHRFTQDAMAKLKDAHKKGDRGRLNELWEKTPRLEQEEVA